MISIHKRSNGAFLTTIRATADRSWVINNKGLCTLRMSVQDEKVIRAYMGQRNLVRIGHPTLPVWGGIIDTDQTWDGDGDIAFTAWSGEALLLDRTPTNGVLSAASPGKLFERLIAEANLPEDMRIRIGNIYQGGGTAEVTLDGANLLDVIRDLAERWDMEFSIDPVTDSKNAMYFLANWYQRQGKRYPHLLSEGFNIRKTSQPLRIQRRVVNDLIGFGDGSSDESRPKYEQIDPASRALYGLMQGVENFDGVITESTIKSSVQKRLRVLRYPKEVIKVTALDKDDTFKYIRLGNTLPFKASTFGFKGNNGIGIEKDVRIIGMRYLEKTNECEITNNTEAEDE